MGRIASKRRSFKIKKKQKHQKELAKLRKAYTKARTEDERKKVLEKLTRLAPYLSKKEFLIPFKSKD
jgi:uncharacterized protein with von Willebrand factor type A (vWA) domain